MKLVKFSQEALGNFVDLNRGAVRVCTVKRKSAVPVAFFSFDDPLVTARQVRREKRFN